jgi:hypothetical protein
MMTYDEAKERYRELLQRWQTGEISQQALLDGVNELRVQSADGGWWHIRAADGTWLRWDGATWEEVPGFRQCAPTAAPPHK